MWRLEGYFSGPLPAITDKKKAACRRGPLEHCASRHCRRNTRHCVRRVGSFPGESPGEKGRCNGTTDRAATGNLENVHFRRLGSDVAVIAYKVSEDLTVEGMKVELEAFDSSVWIKRGGEWVCVLHTESLAGDPFGRD